MVIFYAHGTNYANYRTSHLSQTDRRKGENNAKENNRCGNITSGFQKAPKYLMDDGSCLRRDVHAASEWQGRVVLQKFSLESPGHRFSLMGAHPRRPVGLGTWERIFTYAYLLPPLRQALCMASRAQCKNSQASPAMSGSNSSPMTKKEVSSSHLQERERTYQTK